MNDKEEEKVTINISKLHIGIIIIILGVVTFISASLIFYGEFGVELAGYIIISFGWGFITKYILPNQRGSFFIGVVLGIIGVIVAICIKSRNDKNKFKSNKNKYEELQKLAELKQSGVLTELEFENEKEKLLK